MRERKKRLKRLMAVALSLVVIGGSANLPALTSLAEDGEDGSGNPPVAADVTDGRQPVAQEPEDQGYKKVQDSQGAGTEFKVEVKGLDEDIPDNEELFAGYVEQLFYQGFNDGIATFGEVGKDRLTDANQIALYDGLKSFIEKVAAGTLTSTKDIAIPVSLAWTLDSLGLTPSSDINAVSDAVEKRLTDLVDPVVSYLLMDCPYDFYWFDKTAGYSYGFNDLMSDGAGNFSLSNITFGFIVAREYRVSENWYQFDSSKVSGVQKAADTAAAIVEKHKDKSDYEKLDAYCKEICDLVSYNDEAVNDKTTPYGNPWQLIWVFDGDETTDVVCEGYSKAFQYLCDLSAFRGDTACYTVTGTMDGGTGAGGHMWNIVTIDGKNYLVDVTNSDAGTSGSDGGLFLTGTKPNADGSYTFTIGRDVTFRYDDKQMGLLGAEILTLAETDYVQKPELTINVPEITVTYGDAVSNEVIKDYSAEDKGTPVKGSIRWASEVKSYGDAGKNVIRAEFTPDDLATYAVEMVSVDVIVNPRPITVTAQKAEKNYGDKDPQLGFAIDENTPLVEGDSLAGALGREKGEDVKAGGYAIHAGTLEEENPNYEITFIGNILEIKPTSSYTVSVAKEQNVVAGVGTFAEPVFTDMNQEVIPGSIAYSYNNVTGMKYEDVVSELGKLKVGEEREAAYTFVPGSLNYVAQSGTIRFIVIDIEFAVGSEQATLLNAVTVKRSPTYGDTWADIVKINKITAKVGEESDSDAGHFTLDVSGRPAAGEEQAFRVLYNGTLGGRKFEDQLVCSGTVTVSRRALTWDVSGLQAVDRQGNIKDNNKASLYGELRVSGILNDDSGKVVFNCPASQLTGTYANITAGPQKVALGWAGEPAGLIGTGSENYTLPASLPEITGRINAVSEVTNVPESTDKVKFKYEVETGISQVPPTLSANLELNTPAKIEEKMKSVIRTKLADENSQNNVEVYDVVLMVEKEDGTWVEVTPENFPADGVTVTLPYPEGTGKDTHNFEAAHMCTVSIGEYKPGDIEMPVVTKGETNIQFKVKSLSPISLGWNEIKKEQPTKSGEDDKNSGAAASSRPTAPKTGDTNTILLYALFMMLGAVCIGYSVKRRTVR